MKLVIQIPCLNEEQTLPATLADLPRSLPGVDEIQVLVVDDGSRDRTGEVAREPGAARVVRFPQNRGLARAFARGLQEALDMGADVIVNTDADNQYRGDDIEKLVTPILRGEADMVVGARDIEGHDEFTWLKKRLQRLGSWVVRKLSDTRVPDATSGFRAYSREAALRLTVLSDFTYTLETIIQATRKGIAVSSVPIRTNPKTRESRLFRSIGGYIRLSVGTLLRIYVLYQPLKVFLRLSAVLLAASFVLVARFAYFYVVTEGPTGHVQSLLVGGVLAVIGFVVAMLGILSDLSAMNRRLLEETLTDTRRARLGGGSVEP